MLYFLLKTNKIIFLLMGVFSSLIVLILFAFPNILFNDTSGPNIMEFNPNSSILKMYFIAGIWAPIFETYFFQHLMFKIFKKYKKQHNISVFYYILFTSVLFGLSHYYSILYIMITFFLGFIFAYFYTLSYLRREYSYWNIVIIHSIYNSLLVSITVLLG